MLREWLRGTPMEEFLEAQFQKAPLARPSAARDAVPLLTWDTVRGLVEGSRPDIMVVRDGKLLPGYEPRTIEGVRGMFRSGCSLVMRRCEGHDAGLTRVAESFEEELPGDVSVQVYATPRDHFSFGWHYDCEDVFIVQTAGEKEYLLRENTVDPFPTLAGMPRDMHYERETTPTLATTLLPGDWLYIPRGWWHVAHASHAALSISVGVLSPAAGGKRALPARRAALRRRSLL